MVDLGIKQAVKDWLESKWNNWVRNPIANATQNAEQQAINKTKPHLEKAKATATKPLDYYWNQDAFYRGLFWIAIGLLIVLWIISGS